MNLFLCVYVYVIDSYFKDLNMIIYELCKVILLTVKT